MENDSEVRRKIFLAGLRKRWESHEPNEFGWRKREPETRRRECSEGGKVERIG